MIQTMEYLNHIHCLSLSSCAGFTRGWHWQSLTSYKKHVSVEKLAQTEIEFRKPQNDVIHVRSIVADGKVFYRFMYLQESAL